MKAAAHYVGRLWLRTFLAAPALVLALAAASWALPTDTPDPSYDFDNDAQGWAKQWDGLVTNSSVSWADDTNYPGTPGTDGTGNGEGALKIHADDWSANDAPGDPWAKVAPGIQPPAGGFQNRAYYSARVYVPPGAPVGSGVCGTGNGFAAQLWTNSGAGWDWCQGSLTLLNTGWNTILMSSADFVSPCDVTDIKKFGVQVGTDCSSTGPVTIYVDDVLASDTVIPTLTRWGVIVMAMLMLGTVLVLRRRRAAA